MTGSRSQISKLFGAQGAFPAEFRDHNWPWHNHFVALLIAKWNGPASKFVEALDRINQVPKECVAAHLAVGDNSQPRGLLQLDGFVNCTIFEGLEFRVDDLSLLMSLATLLEIGRVEQTSHHVAWV